jgi:carboxypeptidase C (cathepsin A)
MITMKDRRILGVLLAAAFMFRADAQPSDTPESTPRGRRNAERAAAERTATETKKDATPAGKDKDKDKEPKDELTETTNTVTIHGAEVKYKATTGTIVIKDEEGKALVTFFFIAYTSLDATNLNERPVTFSFNGGPGSASLWLHLGVLGPRRVFLKPDGGLPPPPFRLVNNDESLLDKTDLVFLDPVSTGFTRTVPGEDPAKYHGVDQDLRSVGDFIRLYTTRYDRWLSPKFLIGESYGTTRASGLAGYLEDRYGLYLNGIALVSAVLDFSTISFNVGNDLPYIFFLPTYTATAWFHKKLPPDLQTADVTKALGEAEEFALGDYTLALEQGANLPPAKRAVILKKLSRLTGLSEDYIDRDNLRVRASQFFKELLRKEHLTVGRYDSRVTGEDRDSVGETPEYDPSYTTALGPFAATFNDYVRRELKFESDLPYEVLTGKVQPWDYNMARNRYLDIAENLREAMTHNPYLKVFVANGHYDLATPYLATRYTFDHMGLPPNLRGNVSMGYYEAGHMMYLNTPSRVALKADLARFISAAIPSK